MSKTFPIHVLNDLIQVANKKFFWFYLERKGYD